MTLAPNFVQAGGAFAVLNDWEIDAVVRDITRAVNDADFVKEYEEHTGHNRCIIYRDYAIDVEILDDAVLTAKFRTTTYQQVYRGDYYTPDEVDEQTTFELMGVNVDDERGRSHPLKNEQWQEIERRVC